MICHDRTDTKRCAPRNDRAPGRVEADAPGNLIPMAGVTRPICGTGSGWRGSRRCCCCWSRLLFPIQCGSRSRRVWIVRARPGRRHGPSRYCYRFGGWVWCSCWAVRGRNGRPPAVAKGFRSGKGQRAAWRHAERRLGQRPDRGSNDLGRASRDDSASEVRDGLAGGAAGNCDCARTCSHCAVGLVVAIVCLRGMCHLLVPPVGVDCRGPTTGRG